MESTRYASFDVVVLPFPHPGRPAETRRPALVISNRKLAGRIRRLSALSP